MTTDRVLSRFGRCASFAHRVLLLALVVFLALGATGCKKDLAKPLHGTWGLDHEAWLAQDLGSEMSEDERAIFKALIESMQFAVRFNKDGSYEFYSHVFSDEDMSEGHYHVLSSNKGDFVLEVTNAEGEVKTGEATLHGPDRVALNLDSNASAGDSPQGAEKLPFKRISETEFERYLASAESNTTPQREALAQEMLANERIKKAGAQKLTGTWLLDRAATVALMPQEQQEIAGAFIGKMRVGIVFNADNTLEMHVAMMGERDFQAGDYSILEAEDDRLAIELTRDDSVDGAGNRVEDEPSTMIVAFLDNDRIIFRPAASEDQSEAEAAEETLVLKRVTKAALHDAMNESNDSPSLD